AGPGPDRPAGRSRAPGRLWRGRPGPGHRTVQLAPGRRRHRARLPRGPLPAGAHAATQGGQRMMGTEWFAEHRRELDAVITFLQRHTGMIEAWAADLARRLDGGARLLAAGNGGSAA